MQLGPCDETVSDEPHRQLIRTERILDRRGPEVAPDGEVRRDPATVAEGQRRRTIEEPSRDLDAPSALSFEEGHQSQRERCLHDPRVVAQTLEVAQRGLGFLADPSERIRRVDLCLRLGEDQLGPGLVDAVPRIVRGLHRLYGDLPAGDEIDRIEQRHRELELRASAKPSVTDVDGRAQERPRAGDIATFARTLCGGGQVSRGRPAELRGGLVRWAELDAVAVRMFQVVPEDLLVLGAGGRPTRSSQAANRSCKSARCSFGMAW